jgi:tetratricopeptide (TPR) repeat protein
MSDLRSDEAIPHVANTHVFLLTFGLVIALSAAFTLLDLALARIERAETANHAADLYAEGYRYLATGKATDAMDRFSSAHAMERDSVSYALALGQAILANGNPAQAEETLQPLLQKNASSGAVNLTMARVVLRQGRAEEAKSYYHRAIYGLWSTDTMSNRQDARFELIALLVKQHKKQELIAELLPLDVASSSSPTLRKQLGHLFLVAGSPLKSAEVFRDVLRSTPTDADALGGLGEAELATGRFHNAHANFLGAKENAPFDARFDSLLALTDTVLALDPVDTRATTRERYRRSMSVLRRVMGTASRCPGLANNAAFLAATNAAAMLDVAKEVPTEQLPAQTDANVAMAEQLWKLRSASCAALHSTGETALDIVLAAAGQR